MNDGPIVQVENISKIYLKKTKNKIWPLKWAPDYHHAVKELSFEINKGEKVAFIGPNGSGKSTTIKMLSGLLKPTTGELKVCGYVPWKNTKNLAKDIGIVFGSHSNLWSELTVESSFFLLAEIYQVPKEVFKKQLDILISALSIREFLNKRTLSLSLGERMRCDIAASMLHQPALLFLDEPTIGLDVISKTRLRDHLNLLAKEFNTTILLTSHDTGDVENICERVIIINQGQKIVDSSIGFLKKELSTSKRINIVTADKYPQFNKIGVSTIAKDKYSISIEVDTLSISIEDVIKHCITELKVKDITIENASLDEIIKNIYK